MAKSESHSKYQIKRQAFRDDVLYFGLPALLVFAAGVSISAQEGYGGLTATIVGVILQPQRLRELTTHNIAGLLLFIFGMTLAIVAAATLRHQYSSSLVIREGHELITHGPYRFVRHPIYFGVLIACIGIAVFAGSWLGLLFMLALVPIVLNRIRMEERLLAQEFGEVYEAYRRSTPKLIPFL